MPDTTKIAGFLSYAHDDDKHDNGRISRLRARLELSIRVGTGIRDFTIFQDSPNIGWGSDWDRVITQSLDAVVLLFPVVTPLWFASPNCRDELHKFRQRQIRLGQGDPILPVYYLHTPLMQEDDDDASADERDAAALLRRLQYEDWRALRRTEETDLAYPAAIERLAEHAAPVLRRLRQTGLRGGLGGITPGAAQAQGVGDGGQSEAPTARQESGRVEADCARSPTAIQTRVVDPMGRGDFTTISAALKQAPVGARVLVRPGHYNESLVMDRPIELIGDGDRDDIVVEGTQFTTLTFDTNIGFVRNMTLRHRGDKNCCVWVKQGRLTIEECDISSRGLACLNVNNAADPRVRRNRIHDGAQGGVLLYDDARGAYEDNVIFANALAGIEAKGTSDMVVRRNRLRDGKSAGVLVSDDARGTYEDNDIFANALTGIEVKGKSDPIVRRNRIHDGTGGILVWEDGRGTYEDNDIFANTLSGIDVKGNSDPVVRRNHILAHVRAAHRAATLREMAQALTERLEAGGDIPRGAWIELQDVDPDCFEVPERRFGPDNLGQRCSGLGQGCAFGVPQESSHAATLACGTTRPAR
jgi:F-box protein 11